MSESLKRLCFSLKPLRQVEEYLTKQISAFVPDSESGETSLPTRYHPTKPSEIAIRSGTAWKRLLRLSRSDSDSEGTEYEKLQDLSNKRIISACSEDIRALWDDINVRSFLTQRGIEMDMMPGLYVPSLTCEAFLRLSRYISAS